MSRIRALIHISNRPASSNGSFRRTPIVESIVRENSVCRWILRWFRQTRSRTGSMTEESIHSNGSAADAETASFVRTNPDKPDKTPTSGTLITLEESIDWAGHADRNQNMIFSKAANGRPLAKPCRREDAISARSYLLPTHRNRWPRHNPKQEINNMQRKVGERTHFFARGRKSGQIRERCNKGRRSWNAGPAPGDLFEAGRAIALPLPFRSGSRGPCFAGSR